MTITGSATFLGIQPIHPQSTIAYLVLQDAGEPFRVPCHMRLTCAALHDAFGDGDVRGKVRLAFTLDNAGALLSFEPEDA